MHQVYTGTQIREAEQPLLSAGAGPQLMHQAAWGLAQGVIDLLHEHHIPVPGIRITGLIGAGNNGGDGLWALSFLARRGAHITAICTAGRVHPEGAAAFRAAGGRFLSGPETADYARAEVVIDAVLGTGARGAWEGHPVPEGALVVACDIPSGVSADTGHVSGQAITADLTVTFGGLKVGLFNGAGAAHSGNIKLVDIGLGPHLPTPELQLLSPADIPGLLPPAAPHAHKYTRGVLGVLAGSTRYPGAASLVCAGALATGVGMIRFLTPTEDAGSLTALVLGAHPEVVPATDPTERVQAWLVGSGLSENDHRVAQARQVLSRTQDEQLPAVIDADGLKLIEPATTQPRVLTPHAGEAAALLNRLSSGPGPDGGAQDHHVSRASVEADPLAAAQQLAALTGDVIVLKGPHTIICGPEAGPEQRFIYPGGHPFLATAGSGDTLAGIIAAILTGWAEADSAPPLAAQAAAGVWLHGAASYAVAAGGPFGASQLAAGVRTVVAELL